jgi:hypothetical protein
VLTGAAGRCTATDGPGLVTVDGVVGAAGFGGGGEGGAYFRPKYSYKTWTPASSVVMKIWNGPWRSVAIFAIPSGSKPSDALNLDNPLKFLPITRVTPFQSTSANLCGSFDGRFANLTVL